MPNYNILIIQYKFLIILGGDSILTNKVRKLFEQRFMNKTIIETDSTTAEFIKYMNNTFFTTKR